MRVARNTEACVWGKRNILATPLTAKIFDITYRFYFT
jgi:hypothetical protein